MTVATNLHQGVNNMETTKTYGGNDQAIIRELPLIHILGEFNEVALAHLEKNTGLTFKKSWNGIEAQPITSSQITKLFLTYNFKTQYNDNNTLRNTLLLKLDHHVGFQIDSICFDCVKHNHITTNGLKQGDYLAA